MNRSILIVICDFLLVSLLAFSTVDINKVSDQGTPREMKFEIQTNQVADNGKDLSAVMRMALDEERRNRDKLLGELQQSRMTAEERQKQAQAAQQALLAQEQAAKQALQNQQEAAQKLQQERSDLEQRYTAAQSNLQKLNQQLASTSAEATQSRQQLAQMEADARKQADQSSALRERLAMLEKSNHLAIAEQQRLANQLQVAEVERKNAAELATRMEQEVKVQREEKARLAQQNQQLAEGVKTLASSSGELAREVRENRPLAPNTIFNDFISNRVEARFTGTRPGLIGSAREKKDSHTVLIASGNQLYALCHVQDTPITLWNPAVEWEGMTASLVRNGASIPVQAIYFGLRDPRIVWIPVQPEQAKALGGKVYKLSSDPYKFQDAVLVGTQETESYYGECRFQIELGTPDYVKLDRSFLRGLVGKFNPSKGDLVFSRTGELLGVMANGTYCMMLKNFEAAGVLKMGPDIRTQHTSALLSQLYAMVTELPPKLQ